MATRALLATLARTYEGREGIEIAVESVGGVDAARRVRGGEVFDFVVLASDALTVLVGDERVVPSSVVDVARSLVAVAVRQGAAHPDISSEAAVRRAVLAAPSIGYSTGPSGTALLRLFDRWGIGHEMATKLVQSPAGIPVASLVAEGKVAIGFQQRSELLGAAGIEVVGDLPDSIRIETVFAAGVCATAGHADAARDFLRFMTTPDSAAAKLALGLSPA